MKKLLVLLSLLSSGFIYAQDEFPRILNFDVENKSISDTGEKFWVKETYHFLMLSPQKAIDLKNYGNKECEFNIIGSNLNRIILEYNQPSKLTRKGMCAAGREKGFVFLELDNDKNLLESKLYLKESCLLSIEIIAQKEVNPGVTEYLYENNDTLESYAIKIDLNNIIITREDN